MTFFVVGIDPEKAIQVSLKDEWPVKLLKLYRITTHSGVYELQDDVKDGGTVTVKKV